MQAIILAGGLGTRLRPYTFCFPKPLMPVGNMPILEIIIRQLKKQNIQEIVVSTGYLAELIRAFCGDGKKWGLHLRYVEEKKPLNTAGALKLIPDLDDNFLVMNGDILTDLSFTNLKMFHLIQGSAATIAVKSRSTQIDFGVLKTNESNELIEYIEKPTYNFHVSMGIYFLQKMVVDYIENDEALGMPDLLLRLKADNKKVSCFNEDPLWLDIGRFDDYEKAQTMFIDSKESLITHE